MSKYLIKILAICAFVLILPLATIATVLAVTETRAFTLKVDIAGDTNQSASAKVFVNDKETETITAVKGSEIKLTFVGEGYDFVGWYYGTEKNYKVDDEPVSTEERFSYKLESNVDLTAVCVQKTYTVHYTGFKEDGKTVIDYTKTGYVYGQELDVVEKANPESTAVFASWRIVGGTDYYNNATFPESGEVTVEAVWSENKVVNYYDANGELFKTENYNIASFQDFELMSYDSANIEVAPGYHCEGFKYLGTNTVVDDAEIQRLKEEDFNATTLNIQIVEKENDYNIIYTGVKEDGITPISQQEIVKYGSELMVPEKSDETAINEFRGWKIKDDQSNVIYKNANFVFENNSTVELVAVWGNVLTVNYFTANNDTAVWTKQFNQTTFEDFDLFDESELEAYISEGHHFVNYTNKDTGVDVTDEVIEAIKGENFQSYGATLNILINEEKDSYKVTFVGYNNVGIEDVEFAKTYSYQEQLPPFVENSSFIGWKIENDESGKTYTTADFGQFENNADIKLIAVWKNKVVIIQNADGSEISSTEYSRELFETFAESKIPSVTKITAGHHFDHWETAQGTVVNDAYLNSLKGPNYSAVALIIKAVEKINTYQLTFVDKYDYKDAGVKVTYEYGSNLPGYDNTAFAGWKIAGNDEYFKTADFAAYQNNAEITLGGIWYDKKITYKNSDGSVIKTDEKTRDAFNEITFANMPAPTSVKEGYHFAGWSVNGEKLTDGGLQGLKDSYTSEAITLVAVEELYSKFVFEGYIFNADKEKLDLVGFEAVNGVEQVWEFTAEAERKEEFLLDAIIWNAFIGNTVEFKDQAGNKYEISKMVVNYDGTASNNIEIDKSAVETTSFNTLVEFLKNKGKSEDEINDIFSFKKGEATKFIVQIYFYFDKIA